MEKELISCKIGIFARIQDKKQEMEKLINVLIVGLGGALGSMLRYGVTLLFAALDWSGYLAIMLVNALGSLAIGYLSGSVKDSALLLLLTVGACGGFTTFSTFSMQSVKMLQEGRIMPLLLYTLGTVVICVLMAWIGFRLAYCTSNPNGLTH